ncbi:hypothetical protein BaRGS_00023781, partial [Batillaria attramentaria]
FFSIKQGLATVCGTALFTCITANRACCTVSPLRQHTSKDAASASTCPVHSGA